MFQVVASIFTPEDLRCCVFERQRDKNFRFRRQRIGFNVRPQLSVFNLYS